jgi:hypothetical protein
VCVCLCVCQSAQTCVCVNVCRYRAYPIPPLHLSLPDVDGTTVGYDKYHESSTSGRLVSARCVKSRYLHPVSLLESSYISFPLFRHALCALHHCAQAVLLAIMRFMVCHAPELSFAADMSHWQGFVKEELRDCTAQIWHHFPAFTIP